MSRCPTSGPKCSTCEWILWEISACCLLVLTCTGHTPRKSSSPATIRETSSAGLFFASKRRAKSMRQKTSYARRRANKAGRRLVQHKVAQSVRYIRWDLKCRIAHTHELPIPRFARYVMPLQLERRGQPIHTFIQQLHHSIVAAIDIDFADPDRARVFNLHKGVGRRDSGPAHPTKTFSHAVEKPRSIVIPLIAIIITN